MSTDFKKLINSLQDDIVLIDMLFQWANTPTGTTATNKHGQIPNHKLIEKNLISRYKLNKEDTISYSEKLKKCVEEAGFNYNSGFHEVKWFVNEYVRINPVLKTETLCKLASATDDKIEIVWLYCKLKDQGLQWQWSSYSDNDAEREISKKSFDKFRSLLKTLFNSDPLVSDICHVLIELGFVNELESITSKQPFKRSGEYVFSIYLDDFAKDVDKHIKVEIFNEEKEFGKIR